MKLSTLLLAGSLAANAALVAVYVAKSSPATGTWAGISLRGGAPAQSGVPAAGSPEAAKAAAAAETAHLAQLWAQLSQGGDLHALVAQLRAAGFPPSVIRAIITAQVYEQFSARRRALITGQEETPYWKSQQRYALDPKTMSALRDIGREQTALLKELLGPEGMIGREETLAYQRRQYGDLAADKLEQLQNIASDYNDLRSQIYAKANGLLLPEDREKITYLEKEQRADLAKVLTPEELENYDLRSSTTANLLRSQLGPFDPTEAEFRAIFKATRAAEEQFGGSLTTGVTSLDQMRQRITAVTDQLQGVLTPDRIAELKVETDPQYSMTYRLATRLDLPATAAQQVVAVQQDIQQRATALRSDRNLSGEERNAELAVLAEEATQKITTALGGQRGLDAYKVYGGQWMQNLQPRRPPTPPPPLPAPKG